MSCLMQGSVYMTGALNLSQHVCRQILLLSSSVEWAKLEYSCSNGWLTYVVLLSHWLPCFLLSFDAQLSFLSLPIEISFV